MAGLRRFLWFWLPPLILFLAGLSRAWQTGQADPWDWGWPTALLLAGTGVFLVRRGWLMQGWVALGSVGMALLFCTIAATRAPDRGAALGVFSVALLAVSGGAFVRRRAGVAMLLFTCAGLILWRGPAGVLRPVRDRPALAVITGLPLFWAESGLAGPRDAPIITVLRTRFTVTPIDDPLRLHAGGVRRLLLAQPRGLTPAQMVAIDQWVRRGGVALVLADPLLRWSSALPMGDRRRPPVASQLDPLLRHWGFMPVGAPQQSEIRHFLDDGQLLTLSGAQFYASRVRSIGKGRVVTLGDADAIDDRLWLADPTCVLDPRCWVADTPAQVVHWLGGAAIPGDRRWMRESQDVVHALRWTFLAGIIWAMMGAILLGRERWGFVSRTKQENVDGKGPISS